MTVVIKNENFTLHRVEGYISNIYLADYGKRLLIMDGGVSGDLPVIEDYMLTQMGKTPEDITLAVVSHMHPDHPGGIAEMRKKYGTSIASHSLAGRWYSGPGGLLQYFLDCRMTLSVGKRQKKGKRKVCFKRILKPDYPLDGGEPLPFFPDWQALHLPGHTSHDIALLNKKNGVIFLGDLLINVRGGYDLPMPIVLREKMKKSYAELSGIRARTALLSHGPEIFDADLFSIFGRMEERLSGPMTGLAKKVQLLSLWSHEVWKFRIAARPGRQGVSGES